VNGDEDPTPTFPLESIVKRDALVDDATLKSVVVRPEVPCIERSADGVDVAPTARLPFWKIEKRLVPVEDAIVRGFTPPLPLRENVADGDEEPTPMFPLLKIVNSDALVEDATLKSGVVRPDVP
jgi:hypothetical protein